MPNNGSVAPKRPSLPTLFNPKIDIYALGSRQDTNNRLCKARIDDEDYVRLVKRSRKNMFENGAVLVGRT